MKKKWIFNVLIAGILAFIALNIFSYFFYNVPRRVEDESGATDYKWPANAYHATSVEGSGQGHVNNDGYNNLLNYEEGDKIDVLLMGSSHAEGFNISEEDNMAAVMNENSSLYTYNIGISEHTLLHCLANLENALNKYQPTKYVVIETMSVSFYDDEMENALTHDNELPTNSSPLLDFLQNFKYLKLAFYQYNNLQKSEGVKALDLTDAEKMNELMEQAGDLAEEHNTELIVVFHPTFTIDNNGDAVFSYSEKDETILKEACENNGIQYVNMKETFLDYYDTYKELPYGFANTVPGQGHLNSTGHRLIAEKLIEIMGGQES